MCEVLLIYGVFQVIALLKKLRAHMIKILLCNPRPALQVVYTLFHVLLFDGHLIVLVL